MNQKESQRDQIHNLQKQIAAMEREIEQLYAERKNLVMESEYLLMNLLDSTEEQPMNTAAYLSELDTIMLAQAAARKYAAD